jgi:hypothetical protein
MKKQKLVKSLQISGCVALLVLSGGVYAGSGCEGDQKIEGSSNHTYAPGYGSTVSDVCIKAGRNSFGFSCGEIDEEGCYTLDWAWDCSSVTISGGGTSRYCKEISHTAATFGEDECNPELDEC